MEVVVSLRASYNRLSVDERVNFLYGIEENSSDEAVGFLLSVVHDKSDYDLARIEAIKSVGLLASKSGGAKSLVVKDLIYIARNDSDDDVRNYALQALCWFPEIRGIPAEIESIVLDEDEDDLVRESAFAILLVQKDNKASVEIFNKLKNDSLFSGSV